MPTAACVTRSPQTLHGGGRRDHCKRCQSFFVNPTYSFSYSVPNADFRPTINEIPTVAPSRHLAGNNKKCLRYREQYFRSNMVVLMAVVVCLKSVRHLHFAGEIGQIYNFLMSSFQWSKQDQILNSKTKSKTAAYKTKTKITRPRRKPCTGGKKKTLGWFNF